LQPSGEELLDSHNVYADEMDDHSYSSATSMTRSPSALGKDSTPDGKRAGDPRVEGRPEKKKKKRPIPNLIPIQAANPQSLLKPLAERKPHPSMSEKDLNDICAKSCPTSSLKDFASLIGMPLLITSYFLSKPYLSTISTKHVHPLFIFLIILCVTVIHNHCYCGYNCQL
jgi:hypothetical protein